MYVYSCVLGNIGALSRCKAKPSQGAWPETAHAAVKNIARFTVHCTPAPLARSNHQAQFILAVKFQGHKMYTFYDCNEWPALFKNIDFSLQSDARVFYINGV